MTRARPRSELLTNVKTNDVCAQYYNNHFIMLCYYLNDLTLFPGPSRAHIFYWLVCQGGSPAPPYKTGGAEPWVLSRSVDISQRLTITSLLQFSRLVSTSTPGSPAHFWTTSLDWMNSLQNKSASWLVQPAWGRGKTGPPTTLTVATRASELWSSSESTLKSSRSSWWEDWITSVRTDSPRLSWHDPDEQLKSSFRSSLLLLPAGKNRLVVISFNLEIVWSPCSECLQAHCESCWLISG